MVLLSRERILSVVISVFVVNQLNRNSKTASVPKAFTAFRRGKIISVSERFLTDMPSLTVSKYLAHMLSLAHLTRKVNMVLSAKQVGEKYGVSHQAVKYWIKRGLIPEAYKVGQNWVIPEEALETFKPPKMGRPKKN